jgi:hypothetical protein
MAVTAPGEEADQGQDETGAQEEQTGRGNVINIQPPEERV